MKNDQPTVSKRANTLACMGQTAFYKNTYAHLSGAILLFTLLETIFFRIETLTNFAYSLAEGYGWLVVTGSFLFISSYAERLLMLSNTRKKHYIGFFLYVAVKALVFMPVVLLVIIYTESNLLIVLNQAAIMTLSLFTGLSAISLVPGNIFATEKSITIMTLSVLTGLFTAIYFYGINLGLVFSFLLVALAAASILYQTNNLSKRYTKDQYIMASLCLFTSLMLLFWFILTIHLED